nr:immunoglobulin heavy chain junction region [Mus musculus]MBK4196791.1 immunoglobulin heavy chain junction region [Mus musculus]
CASQGDGNYGRYFDYW